MLKHTDYTQMDILTSCKTFYICFKLPKTLPVSTFIDKHSKKCCNITWAITTQPCFPLVDGDVSSDEEEADSNNDGGSLHSERTDKDEEPCEGKNPQAT